MLESILKSGSIDSAATSEGLTRIPGRTARTHPTVSRIQTGAQQLRGTEGVLLIMPATIVSSETSLWCHFAHWAADFRARYVERPNMPFFRQILLVSIFCCRATGIGRIHVGINCCFWEKRRFQLAHGRKNGGVISQLAVAEAPRVVLDCPFIVACPRSPTGINLGK